MVQVTHKLKKGYGRFAYSECGKGLHLTGGRGTPDWKDVTCKHCLKHKEKNK